MDIAAIKKRLKQAKKENPDELGFGAKYSNDVVRMVNKDGSFNVKKEGAFYHLYNHLISMSWKHFFLLVLLFYLIINTLFAFIYLLIGVDSIAEADTSSFTTTFFSAFFLSAQTLTTVGFGFFRPHGIAGNLLASIEAMLGLMSFALATGLLYGRFTKPEAGVVYTEHALVSPYKDIKALIFRVANKFDNNLIEVEAKVLFTILEEVNGQLKRTFYPLTLETPTIQYLSMNWTIVHPIDENSPLYFLDESAFINGKAEVLVLLKAFNESFSQNVHSRSSYKADEIIWNAKFNFPYRINTETGETHFDLKKLDDYVLVD